MTDVIRAEDRPAEMTITELVASLRERGVRLRAANGKLHVSAPDGALTPELKEALATHKSGLLELFDDGPSRPSARIAPRSGDGPGPLSFAQERIWLFDRMSPGDTTYNLGVRLRLEGRIDVGALAECLDALVERHEPLRTSFEMRAAGPVQVVRQGRSVELQTTDLSSLPPDDRHAEKLRLRQVESERPFDLERDLLLRAHLLHTSDTSHELLLTTHHVAADGASFGVLLDDLAALYAGRLSGAAAPLPELSIRYGDFADWQRATDESGGFDELLEHWTALLDGAPPVLELATDHPRGKIQSFAGGSASMVLETEVVEALSALGRAEGATPFATLFTAFFALLHRNTGVDDIVVGTPVHGRDSQALRGLVGMFVNTLPVRVDLRGNPTLRDLLRRVRDASFDAFAHDGLPFAKLVDVLRPERDLSITPVFQVMFNMFSEEIRPHVELPGVELHPPSTAELVQEMDIPSKFDLTLYAREEGSQVHLALVYNAEIFEAERMDEMMRQLERLLHALAFDADTPVTAVALDEVCRQADREAARQLAVPAQGAPPMAPEASIVDRFAEMVALHAERPAIVGDEHVLTYRELADAAGRVAQAILQTAGGRAGRVGLLMAHEDSMVAGVFGTLMAGGAFVPLDTTYPMLRLEKLLQDSDASVILVNRGSKKLGEELAERGYVVIDVEDPGTPPAALDVPEVAPDDEAYVLFTSGSTGKPKGVVQSHRNVLFHARNHGASLGIVPADRLSLLGTLSHDAALVDIFGALLHGASICPVDVRRDGVGAIGAAVERHGVTVYHSTPTILLALNEVDVIADFSKVRLAVLGGEAVTRGHVEAFRRRFSPQCFLLNGYGATEFSWACHRVFGPGEPVLGATLPIGRPLPGVRVDFVDEGGNLHPMHGEIVIRSRHLPEGYHDLPEATAAAFVVDPDDAPHTMYRTGDLGFRQPDGTIAFLGRRDRQAKIRGFRVEPSEVEAVLESHEQVEEAAVDTRGAGPGGAQLVGYVVVGEGADMVAVRQYLEARLPSYMVPGSLVALEALPRTRSGKLDRRQLAELDTGAAEETPFIAPRDGLEEALADIWCEVLGVSRVGVNDSFFALGGNSLNTTQVTSRVFDVLGVELPLRDFFLAPTLGQVADSIRDGDGGGERALAIQPVDRDGLLPLTFSQERMWFFQQLAPESTAYNLGVGVRLTGPLDVDALQSSLQHVADRHEILRTSFDIEDGRPVQRVLASVSIELPYADLRALPDGEREDEAHRRAADLVSTAFDLGKGPLMRLLLLRLGDDEYYLTVSFHHIVGDVWSMTVFGRDLAACYRAFVFGEKPDLAPMPVQYADYAVWQRALISGDRLAELVRYWRSRLDGAVPLELPTDRPRPRFQTFAGSRISSALTTETTEALRRLCAEESATPFMALLACFNVLLARYTGQDDISVGVPIANRTHVQVENLIGPFVNTLVHRNDLGGDPSFRELLGRVREVAVGAYAHQDLPFEKLVEELAVERDTSRSPLFQVLFNVVNTPGLGDRAIEQLSAEPIDIHRDDAQFELVLNIVRQPDAFAFQLGYNTDLFDRATAERILEHYGRIVDAAVRTPETPLSEFDMMTEREQRQLLSDWNDTATDVPETSYIELFQRQAEETPEAVAAICGADSLTYEELNRRSNRLAARLRRLGVDVGHVVGASTERSLDMLVGLLAIQKSGAAYLPLDPGYPEQRIAFMVEDSGAHVIVADADTSAGLPTGVGEVVIVDAPTLVDEPDGNPEALPGPEDLVYLMYTSGSTGKPKGVQIAHKSLVNFLCSMRREPGVDAGDTLLSVTTVSFDISCLELYLPLLVGAKVVIAERAQAEDGYRLAQLVEECGATVMQATPATWQLLINSRWQGSPSLKALSGGEALSRELAHELLQRCGELWNMYGPTETTIWSTIHRVERDDDPIPIGRPIDNTSVYVLDAGGRIQPIGVPGEICIGGAGVARGYLGRSELTAERFVADRLGVGETLYRTGDLGRIRADGRVEHLGRMDHQVKIRGHRVELGEIESVLRAAAPIRAAVAIVREGRVVAYVVFEEGVDLTPMEVRDIAAEQLPGHMVPGLVVALDELPLTPNGKIDRASLPEPFQRTSMAAGQYVAPATDTERLVADIWGELLPVERVGSMDQFFVLGGHSLLAMQAVVRIEERTGTRIDPRLMFFQNLRQIANVVERSITDESLLEV